MKDKNVAAILALFLGGIGVHKFYLGRIGTGILYLLFCFTMIPSLLGLIDFFVLALMDNDEFNRRFNGSNMIAPVVVNMLPPAGYGAPNPYGYGPPPGGMHPGMQPGGMHPGMPPQPGHPGYGQPSAAPRPGGLSPDELAKKLEKLNELRISGLLTEEEFNQQKARLLGQM